PLRRGWPGFRPAEFLLQGLGVALAMLVVARFSEPGTLHLKYLLFVPIFWMVVRGGTRVASLGFLVLNLAMALAVLQRQVTADAVLGAQAFLLVLFSVSLYLAAAVDAHAAILAGHERSSRRLNQLLEGTGAIPWEMDLVSGRCGYLGPGAVSLLGLAPDAWHKQPYWGEVLHPDDQLSFLKFLKDVGRPDQDHQLEFRLRAPEGREHWVRAVGGVEPGTPDRAMGFLFDIHAHKRAEENALRASLKEKDLLLREIHHRVKNNLQVVSSLLRLQAAGQVDPALQRALHEAQERIQAIALIHQKLKHAPDYSQLDLPGYVRTLAERLVRSYASVPALIDLQVRVAEVDIGPDAPVPLGLILNELVANALQHAFPPGTGGSLDIEIAPDGDGWILVRVADSGVGLPESVELAHGGLGFQLVQALTDQLGGALELERRRGASFLLRFPPSRRQP
ncbi:MAG TPA: histidine kinase dimerization/phosphoacceptor domain -containing protein, partial [Geothrix sp.]|nr:histidine kinase dimerization/phosphoacceptor domain -containing protein [Geothrix sp.]